MESEEPVKVNFHPSCMLTIGDCLAFSRELSAAQPWAAGSGAVAVAMDVPAPERPPSAAASAAPDGGPQRALSATPPLPRSLSRCAPTPPAARPQSAGGELAADGAPRRSGARRETDPADDPLLGAADGGGGAGAGAAALGALGPAPPAVAREAPPGMAEQMALGGCITSRVPQRCAMRGSLTAACVALLRVAEFLPCSTAAAFSA